MAFLIKPVAAIAGALLLLTGCVGKAVNQAQVYSPVTGVIEVDVKVPAGETYQKVQFQVNNQLVSEDDDPTDGFSAQIDTSTLDADTLAKVAAVGVRADGTSKVLRENFILVGAQPAASGTADASASGAAAASGTSQLKI